MSAPTVSTSNTYGKRLPQNCRTSQEAKIIMNRNNSPAQVLVLTAMNAFDELEQTKVLMEAWWNLNSQSNLSQERLDEIGLLLLLYEQRRNEYLELLGEILEELRETVFK